MAEIEFKFNTKKEIIRCNINEKIKDICKRLAIKLDKDINKIYFIYDEKLLNENLLELSFLQIAKDIDKERKKMILLVYDKEIENKINLDSDVKESNKKNELNKKNDEINEIKIIYKVNKDKMKNNKVKIKIFDWNFVKNYKNECIFKYKEKEYKLEEYFNLEDINNEILEIKLININKVKDMSYMFYKCKELISLPDISKWNTINVTDMKAIFQDCSSLSSLPDISIWSTNNVTNMSWMFSVAHHYYFYQIFQNGIQVK